MTNTEALSFHNCSAVKLYLQHVAAESLNMQHLWHIKLARQAGSAHKLPTGYPANLAAPNEHVS